MGLSGGRDCRHGRTWCLRGGCALFRNRPLASRRREKGKKAGDPQSELPETVSRRKGEKVNAGAPRGELPETASVTAEALISQNGETRTGGRTSNWTAGEQSESEMPTNRQTGPGTRDCETPKSRERSCGTGAGRAARSGPKESGARKTLVVLWGIDRIGR